MSLKTNVVVGLGGVAVALIAGSGIASAVPGEAAIINSTCTYQQVIDALNAQDPVAAGQITGNPFVNGALQGFINSGPTQRQQFIDQYRGAPEVQQNIGLISQVVTTCNNY